MSESSSKLGAIRREGVLALDSTKEPIPEVDAVDSGAEHDEELDKLLCGESAVRDLDIQPLFTQGSRQAEAPSTLTTPNWKIQDIT
ncbi:hypothetical protein IAR50_006969 [Cryptococcus sp. DSM 104548]